MDIHMREYNFVRRATYVTTCGYNILPTHFDGSVQTSAVIT